MGEHIVKAGSATVDITPPVDSRMACFPEVRGEKARRARGVHQPLLANALILSNGSTTVGMCSCDLSFIHRLDVEKIRTLVGDEVDELDGPNLVIAATHTHSAPENTYLFESEPGEDHIERINKSIARCIINAAQSLSPCHLSVGHGQLDLSHNRRIINDAGQSEMILEHTEGKTEGPTDPTLMTLLCRDTNDNSLAILFNWTAHALTLGPDNRLFSPDYPGVSRKVVQREHDDAPTLFFNGAAGNIHPHHCMRSDTDATREIGEALGNETLNTLSQAQPINCDSMNFLSKNLVFPHRLDTDRDVTVEVSMLRVDSVLLVFVPGEVFVEFQKSFRHQSDYEDVFFVGYANGWPGYIPTREAYRTGGYGVDIREDDPPEFSRTKLPKGAGEEMLMQLLLMEQVI